MTGEITSKTEKQPWIMKIHLEHAHGKSNYAKTQADTAKLQLWEVIWKAITDS